MVEEGILAENWKLFVWDRCEAPPLEGTDYQEEVISGLGSFLFGASISRQVFGFRAVHFSWTVGTSATVAVCEVPRSHAISLLRARG